MTDCFSVHSSLFKYYVQRAYPQFFNKCSFGTL